MEKLEKKLWFVALVGALSAFVTLYLLEAAGLPKLAEMNIAQLAVAALSYHACSRLFSFCGWLLALCFGAPATR
ncbi:hypothetical protein [Massilia sp. METH4]|uniref:hypothetical protein n=1 Tax=Massilia sp. METH4 TaxID=3123041 RepID=UPI0030D44803